MTLRSPTHGAPLTRPITTLALAALLSSSPALASWDTDQDGVPDEIEILWGTHPERTDSDGDMVSDLHELGLGSGMLTEGEALDTDGDDIIDALDPDDDNDGVPTAQEDRDGDGNPLNDDWDGDGIPDFRDARDHDGPLGDSDGDGLTNAEELALGSNPDNWDSDRDGVADGDEVGPYGQAVDTDQDGTPDALDSDDDGDGIPTADEHGDTDGDGLVDALDADDDGDGVPTRDESRGDTDGDGEPDYLDGDSDGDGVPDGEEMGDVDCDGRVDYVDDDVQTSQCAWDETVIAGRSCSAAGGPPSPWWLLPLVALRRRTKR